LKVTYHCDTTLDWCTTGSRGYDYCTMHTQRV